MEIADLVLVMILRIHSSYQPRFDMMLNADKNEYSLLDDDLRHLYVTDGYSLHLIDCTYALHCIWLGILQFVLVRTYNSEDDVASFFLLSTYLSL